VSVEVRSCKYYVVKNHMKPMQRLDCETVVRGGGEKIQLMIQLHMYITSLVHTQRGYCIL
jgi:hypothetical protein